MDGPGFTTGLYLVELAAPTRPGPAAGRPTRFDIPSVPSWAVPPRQALALSPIICGPCAHPPVDNSAARDAARAAQGTPPTHDTDLPRSRRGQRPYQALYMYESGQSGAGFSPDVPGHLDSMRASMEIRRNGNALRRSSCALQGDLIAGPRIPERGPTATRSRTPRTRLWSPAC